MDIKYQTRFPRGPNGERLPMYEVAVGCVAAGGDKSAALADIERFLTPAPIRTIEAWIAELDAITVGRGRDGVSAEIALTAYASRLSKFPADVARYALIERTWKWFPSWAELEVVCTAKAAPRLSIAAALREPDPEPEVERRGPTAEEKARIAALIAEQFPAVPQEWREAAFRAVTRGEPMAVEPLPMEAAE